MSKALIPLETIADDVCADLNDSTSRYKFSIIRKLMAGLREINLYIDQSFCVKTAVLAYDNVISLPNDFVYLTKVGVKRNGKIAMLTLSDHVERHILSQEETDNQLNCVWNGNFTGNGYWFYNYSGVGELYGMGNHIKNCNGYYSIDQGKGEIYVGSLLPSDTEFVVEYKSAGGTDGMTLVPIQYWNCLKEYGLSEWYGTSNLGFAKYHRDAYEREYNKNQRLNNYKTALFMAEEAQSMYKTSPR